MKRAALLFLVLAAALVVIPSTAAWACSCASVPTHESVAHADLVVRGTPGAPRDVGDGVEYLVTVAEAFKGTAPPVVTVRSATDGNTCGIDVVPGREYVLFANERGGTFRAGLCGGTAPATDGLVGQVERVTGAGVPAAQVATPSSAGPTSTRPPQAADPLTPAAVDRMDEAISAPALVGLGVLVAVAACVGVVLVRRRRV